MAYFWPQKRHQTSKYRSQNTSNIKHWNKWELYIHLRKIHTNEKDNSFPTRLFQFRVKGGWSTPGGSGRRWDPPWSARPFITGHTHPRTHLHWDILDSLLTSGVCLWDGGGVPGENPRGHGENVKTPRTVALAANRFFSSTMITKPGEMNTVIREPATIYL